MSMTKCCTAAMFALAIATVVACSRGPSGGGGTSAGPSAEGAKYVLADEPAGAKDVIKARDEAKENDELVVVGRIGGSKEPWVEGLAAFTVVDKSFTPCNEREGDNCTTPWDYCCDLNELPKAKASVQVVDAQGETLKVDARKLLGLKELQTVVVRGRAKRDEAGNLTVLASGIYVRR